MLLFVILNYFYLNCCFPNEIGLANYHAVLFFHLLLDENLSVTRLLQAEFLRCTTHSSSVLTLSWPLTSLGYKVTDRYCHQWWSLESADDSFHHQPPHPSLSTCHSSHFTQVTSRHLFLL